MTSSDLHNAVRERFSDEVGEGLELTVIYDNDPQSPPADGSIWCRCSIKRADTIQVEIGPSSYRKHGRVYAQLFGPVAAGDGDLLELADGIEAAFQGVTAGGVRYGAVTVRPVGVDGHEYQVNVEIPFMAD
ncbi:MAG TPA: phage tail terminator-like protein [Phycisphaerae bacterium]|nr:phage tail terminator-like protein [Phycisphaerae bacterium]